MIQLIAWHDIYVDEGCCVQKKHGLHYIIGLDKKGSNL